MICVVFFYAAAQLWPAKQILRDGSCARCAGTTLRRSDEFFYWTSAACDVDETDMSQIASGLGTNQNTLAASAGSAASQASNSGYDLKAEDFIEMMIVQLQNQDPTEPAKNEQLLAQMSQIGQLQSSTELQASLETMTLQSNLGAAGNMIGKEVEGLDAEGDPVDGIVTSVRAEGNNVWLELDNGQTVRLDYVTKIANQDGTAVTDVTGNAAPTS